MGCGQGQPGAEVGAGAEAEGEMKLPLPPEVAAEGAEVAVVAAEAQAAVRARLWASFLMMTPCPQAQHQALVQQINCMVFQSVGATMPPTMKKATLCTEIRLTWQRPSYIQQ